MQRRPPFEIDITEIERNQLADPHAGRIERLQHGLIAEAFGTILGRGPRGLRQELVDLGRADRAGRVLLHPRRAQLLGRVDAGDAPLDQVCAERLERRGLPGDRRSGIFPAAEVQDIGAAGAPPSARSMRDRRNMVICRRALHICAELVQIIAIGGNRVRRKSAFSLQRGQELLDCGLQISVHVSLSPSPPDTKADHAGRLLNQATRSHG